MKELGEVGGIIIEGEKIEEKRQDTKERGQRREETETQSASRGQCNLTDNSGLRH